MSFNGHYTSIYRYNRDQDVFQNNSHSARILSLTLLANQDTNIYTAKADYSLPINETSSLDAGVKFSNVNTDSDITLREIINGVEVINAASSNAFDYDENSL